MKDSTVPLILGLMVFSTITLTIMGRVSKEVNTASIIPANTQQIRGLQFDPNAEIQEAHTTAPEFETTNEFFDRFFSHKQEMIIFAGDLSQHPNLPAGANLQGNVDKTDEILNQITAKYRESSEVQLGSEEVLSSFFGVTDKSKDELLEILDQHYRISEEMRSDGLATEGVDEAFTAQIAEMEVTERQLFLDIINQMP